MYHGKQVFQRLRHTVVVPNVRDAVVGLAIDSNLEGPVEYYGDRLSIMPAQAVFLKQPKNQQEEYLLEEHRRFLLAEGVGPAEVQYIPTANSHGDGIVSRLIALTPEQLQLIVAKRPLIFFMDTTEADLVTKLAQTTKLGAKAVLARRLNNKAEQREMTKPISAEIFPPYSIVRRPEEIEPAFKALAAGEVMVKVPHLASGEGMVQVNSLDQVQRFFQDWQKTLAHYGFPPDIIIEQKMPLAPNGSTSVQFFKQDEELFFLGCSAQHMGQDGFVHEGNMVGADIHSRVPPWVESEMLRLSSLVLDNIPDFQGFIGFDFIVTAGARVLLTEINLRITASTLLFALMAQLGEDLSYDLRKIHVGKEPKVTVVNFLQRLREFNQPHSKVIPLNPRLFDESGDMFLAICAPTFNEIEQVRKEIISWF